LFILRLLKQQIIDKTINNHAEEDESLLELET